MELSLVTPPAQEPLSVDDVRTRLNISVDELSDGAVMAMISAARQTIDGPNGWLGRALITQTWDLFLDGFPDHDYYNKDRTFYQEEWFSRSNWRRRYWKPSHGIELPLPPLQSIVSVKYLDADYLLQTVDPALYTVVKGEPAHLISAGSNLWPSSAIIAGSVVVRFNAGYGDEAYSVPESVRMAIALQVAHMRALTGRNLYLAGEDVPGVASLRYVVSQNAGNEINAAVQNLLLPLRVAS
jgi:hypothetical protein